MLEDEENLEAFIFNLLIEDEEVEEEIGRNALENLRDVINEEPLRKMDIGVNANQWRLLADPTFPKHYRMEKVTFERLVLAVGNHFIAKDINVEEHFRQVPLDLSLLMCVWVLATNDTFRSIGVKFGKSESVVYHQYVKVVHALVEMGGQYVAWPNERERRNIKYELERRYGYPGVVGAIDGTHIYISAPLAQRNRYVNRHHRYSVQAQAVCDDRLIFRDIYVGEPGSVGDVRMFNRSELKEKSAQETANVFKWRTFAW